MAAAARPDGGAAAAEGDLAKQEPTLRRLIDVDGNLDMALQLVQTAMQQLPNQPQINE